MAAKQRKVLPSTIPDQTISGHHYKLKRTKILTSAAKNRGHRAACSSLALRPQNIHKKGHVPSRTPHGNHPSRHIGQNKILSIAATNPGNLGQEKLHSRQGFVLIPRNSGFPDLVDRQGKSVHRETLEAKRTKNPYHRRQWRRGDKNV